VFDFWESLWSSAWWKAEGLPHLLDVTPPQWPSGNQRWQKVAMDNRIIPYKWRLKWDNHLWLVWNIFYFSIYWECHHPNWGTHIFQRGGSTTKQMNWGELITFHPTITIPILKHHQVPLVTPEVAATVATSKAPGPQARQSRATMSAVVNFPSITQLQARELWENQQNILIYI